MYVFACMLYQFLWNRIWKHDQIMQCSDTNNTAAHTVAAASSPDVELQKALSFNRDVVGVFVWFQLSFLSLWTVDDLGEIVPGRVLRDTTLTETHTLLCVNKRERDREKVKEHVCVRERERERERESKHKRAHTVHKVAVKTVQEARIHLLSLQTVQPFVTYTHAKLHPWHWRQKLAPFIHTLTRSSEASIFLVSLVGCMVAFLQRLNPSWLRPSTTKHGRPLSV